MRNLTPRCVPLAIGSVPYKDAGKALESILKYFPEIPFWPQLPMADEQEQMYIQYFEGMSGISFAPDKHRLVAGETDDRFFEEMAITLEHAISEDLDYFKISPNKARGFYEYISKTDKIKALKPMWVKGHITGPVSFGLVITDNNMKPVLYDESYREIVREVLRMKALWQVEELRKIHPDVIILIDEPYMASLGSSMVALSGEEASGLMGSIVEAIEDKNAVSGIHCCGNTDWTAIIRTGCRIISFDAYEYGDKFLLYRDEIADYMKNGGTVAWGIIPTSEAVYNEDSDSLILRLEKMINRLTGEGLEQETILVQSFISPSCGLGNIPVERAERIMELTGKISRELREKYCL
jgi:methionine synthase II (cobalamin-independent)